MQGNLGDVEIANGHMVTCASIGYVCLMTSNEYKFILKQVIHVLDIQLNLFLISKFHDDSFDSDFFSDKWKLRKGSMFVAGGKKYFTLNLTQIEFAKDVVNAAKSNDEAKLWHR